MGKQNNRTDLVNRIKYSKSEFFNFPSYIRPLRVHTHAALACGLLVFGGV